MFIAHLSILSIGFVAVLDSSKDRNELAEIKSRIKRVSLVTLVALGYTSLVNGYSLAEMGLSTTGFMKSIAISLGLSAVLFLGPLSTQSWHRDNENIWITIRNLVVVMKFEYCRVLLWRNWSSDLAWYLF